GSTQDARQFFLPISRSRPHIQGPALVSIGSELIDQRTFLRVPRLASVPIAAAHARLRNPLGSRRQATFARRSTRASMHSGCSLPSPPSFAVPCYVGRSVCSP